MRRKLGIVRHGKALAYGMSSGRLRWLPYKAQHWIVHVWNTVSCTIYGHTGLLYGDEDKLILFPSEKYPVCTNCCADIKGQPTVLLDDT